MDGHPSWERWFRAPRFTLPAWAKLQPQRCVFVTDLPGLAQVYTWDCSTGALRQVTDSPGGSRHCAIAASGRHVWWFADDGGDETGVWMRQPFGGGADSPVLPDAEPAWQAGLAMGLDDHCLIGLATDEGTDITLLYPDGTTALVSRYEEPAAAVDLSRSLDLIAVDRAEDGDLWNPAVRILRPDGSVVADIPGAEAVGFSPVRGDDRLLMQAERDEGALALLFDPRRGTSERHELDLAGEVGVEWYQDGSALLVHHSFRARSELYRYDPATRDLRRLRTPAGTVEYTRTRPDGGIWYLWSDSAHPVELLTLDGDGRSAAAANFALTGGSPPSSAQVEDAWVPGPGGLVHALITRPSAARAPYPTVFLLHGGPDEHDQDAFDPECAAWIEQGFAVVRVNYRGSSGYGRAWREALRARVGHVELEDVAAVRAWALASGLADPDRLVLAGASWGGYLTLLGLGLYPQDWSAGVAAAPIADCAMAYEDEREDVRALDRALFGGSPQEVPDLYRESSPSTYAHQVRVPVFISAAANDPRCPIRQVHSYARRLDDHGVPHELYVHRSGHSSTVMDERVDMFQRAAAFIRDRVGSAVSREAV